MKMEFEEVQRFTQWWLWLLLFGVLIIPIIGIILQIILEQPYGDKPMSDIELILFAVSIMGLILLFRLMKLKTKIDREEIKMAFVPFVKKNIRWEDIEKAVVVDYGFVGGWGIRL